MSSMPLCQAVSRLGQVKCEYAYGHDPIRVHGETYDHAAPTASVFWSTIDSREKTTVTPKPADPSPWSNVTHWVADDSAKGGHHERLTWKQLYEQEMERRTEAERFKKMFMDLTRNANGRHEGDIDGGDPTGVSQGNPHLRIGDVIGYGIGGSIRYVVPDREHSHDIDAWIEER